jgi:ABC-type phosphate/phosphonate transport system permease subunit
MHALQLLEGLYADAHKFIDLRVGEALKEHGKSHLFQLVRDVTADHVVQHMAQHAGHRRLTFGRRCLIVLSTVYRAQVNTSDILLGRVSGFSPLLI